jgi:hypothetical protein
MPDSRALMGVGVPSLQAELLGSLPQVIAGTGTSQATAAALTSKNVSINGQSSQTGVYLPTATASPIASRILYEPYYLNYSTLSAANPVIYVGLGGYLNGTLNGSTTLTAGQACIAWQQASGLYYVLKNNT